MLSVIQASTLAAQAELLKTQAQSLAQTVAQLPKSDDPEAPDDPDPLYTPTYNNTRAAITSANTAVDSAISLADSLLSESL